MAGEFVDEKSWPFDDGDGQYVHEDEWAYMARRWQDDGVSGQPSGNALKLSVAGVASNEIKIQYGQAQFRGFIFGLLIDKIVAVPSWADATGPRWDRVVLRLNTGANTFEPAISVGTKNTLPALGANDLELGTISVASTGVVTILNDTRQFMGSRHQVYSSATGQPRPPATDRVPYTFAFDVDTNRTWKTPDSTTPYTTADPLPFNPAVSVYRGGGMSLTGTSLTAIPWDNDPYELNTPANSMHSVSTNPTRLIAPVNGIYYVEFQIQLAASTSGVGFTVQTQIRKNGTNVRWGSNEAPTVASHSQQDVYRNSMAIQLAAGDYVEFFVSSTISGHGVTAGSTTTAGSMTLMTAF